jgi:flagellar biosynthetic protein FliR
MDTAAYARLGLLLVRPGMMVATVPMFGGGYVPAQVRIGLALLLGLIIAPVVPSPERIGGVGIVAAVAGEAAVGLAIGLGVRVLIAGAELAGYLAGFQIGFSYAAIVDPQSGVRNNLVAALYGTLAIIVFFGINGHHAVIRALVASYDLVPIGGIGLDGPLARVVAELLGFVFLTGARLAAPVVTVLLVVELALGLIARAAPALNLMIVGTPVRLIAGLAALAAGVQVLPQVISSAAGPAVEAAARLLRALG